MFIDIAKIKIVSGKGGDGKVGFHREKYVAAGGPDGGDGGRGGSVIFKVDDNLSTLLDFRYKKKYVAAPGEPGGGKRCKGKDGADLIIRVPRGTIIRDQKTGQVMKDMSDSEPFVAAKGGNGGWGNTHFATPTRQAPRFAKPGLPGVERDIILELKLLADVGLVGIPNVGKSTLVNRILGRRAAVVEDTPGVTRDRVSYDAEWAGTDFKLVDTGGWEADVEGIESAIASQAQIAVQLADAVVLVVDGQVGLTNTDERIVKMLRASGKPVTLAVNKVDDRESEYLTAEFWKMGLGEPYGISAMHGRGIGELLDAALDSLKKAEKTSGFLTPSHLRRVALVGRPNVGKSSLLNQLAHEERTVVNDLAGTTRDPVDEVVTVDGEDWLFIDTAGIKRRLHKLSGAEYFSSLRTQAAIERSELALVLFDASQPISDQDLKVMSQAVDAGRCIVLVFNKWDLMDDFDRQRMERLWKTEFDRVTWAQRVNLSAKTGWHTNRLARAMRGALESWDKRIPTGKLNAFLGKIQAAHPHPLRGGKQPRILFATQASTRPPRFVIFATGFLEHGYRRYIERCLREEFGFEGSPIQISVNIREKKKRK